MQTLLGFYSNTGLLSKTYPMAATQLIVPTRYIPFPFGKGITSCTVFCKLTSASSTKSIAVSAQMIYGNNILSDSFALGTVVATTSGVNGVYKLERDFSGYFDPNAEGILITFTKTTGIAITIEMGINIDA